MAFAFREQGERSKLAEHIKTLVAKGPDGNALPDQTLLESAKASTLSQLAALPKDLNGALAIIEIADQGNTNSITSQVIGHKGHY